MAYIATTQPTTAIGNGGAIIVAQTVREANWMRSMWHELFGAHIPMPKFMSVNQNFEGMSGVVFTDGVEPHLRERIPFRPHVLIDGGGVGR